VSPVRQEHPVERFGLAEPRRVGLATDALAAGYNAGMPATMSRALVMAAALLMAAATGLGAYASHGLDPLLGADALSAFRTAVDYQFFHALGLIGVALYGERHPAMKALPVAAILLLVGIAGFCGGVYSSSLDGPSWLSALAPAGGISLIAGWLVVAFAAARQLAARQRGRN
jgi:uncharacterized membrane protein YgdD (TMEM256/DUF423 family)